MNAHYGMFDYFPFARVNPTQIGERWATSRE